MIYDEEILIENLKNLTKTVEEQGKEITALINIVDGLADVSKEINEQLKELRSRVLASQA